MKKLIVLGAAGLMLVPTTGATAKLQGTKQEVSGSVAAPAPYTDDSGCYAGLHRRVAILGMEQVNGDIGYHFDVDEKTAGKPFILEVTGGQGTVDLDITFYQKFGTPEDIANDPVNVGSPVAVSEQTREAGGESGIVPKGGFVKAIVCMYGGTAGYTGVGASFTYTAGKGVKLPK